MKKFGFVFVLCFILSGCANVMVGQLDDARESFANNDFIESATQFADNKNISEQNSLELLITGLNQFQAQDYRASDTTFEEFNKRNINTTSGSILREATNIIAGRMASEYRPYMMDSLFVSYYQIWDAIGDGRHDDVRVIINQSYARQQEMSREYADLVEKNSEKNTPENSELVSKLEENKANWAAYTDIMNPALMYLAGIWFLNDGDFNDAETYLKRAVGMSDGNSYVATDLDLSEQKTKPTNTTWIFIESGFAPRLRQETVSLPIVTNNGIIWSAVAIAVPEFGHSAVYIPGVKPLADVNAMFMTEFNEYSINDALRAFTATSARTIAQSAVYNSDSPYAGLFGLGATLFSVATTDAEIRSWVTLPENIGVMRVNTTDLIGGKLNDKLGISLDLKTSGNYLIYVRLTGNTPIVHTFKI
ncbi:MAG: hypothetical protein MJ164_00930 [Alphaproteobacteria bacterium]|nr:hypothetical protein [Alphaproteobacteria bacterium]